MAKHYKILVNTGKESDNRVLDVPHRAAAKGKPLHIKAQSGNKYQLQEMAERAGDKNVAPDYVKTRRVGKDLHIIFEGDKEASIIIDDYYDTFPKGYNGLIGQAENGSFYEYVPEDPNPEGLVPNLRDGAEPVNSALGGSEVQPAGAAVGLLLFNPLIGALGLLGAAAAVSSTNAGDTTPPAPPAFVGTDDKGPIQGTIANGSVTDDKTPTFSGTAEAGAIVTIRDGNIILGSVTAGANGQWRFTSASLLSEGQHTITATAKDAAGNTSTTSDSLTFTIDTTVPNGNQAVALTIDADEGNDGFINFNELQKTSGKITVSAGFDKTKVSVGDLLTLTASDGSTQTIALTQAMVTAGKASTSFDNPVDGNTFTVKATLQDVAGNTTPEAKDSAKLDLSNLNPVSPSSKQGVTISLSTDANNDGILNATEINGSKVNGIPTLNVNLTLPSDAKAGDILVVTGTGNNTQTITLTPDHISAGKLSTTLTAPDNGGKIDITAQVGDTAGNKSNIATDSAIVNTTPAGAPTVEITTDTNGDGFINKSELNGASNVSVKAALPTGAAVGDIITLTDGTTTTTSTHKLNADDISKGFVTDSFKAPASGSAIQISATMTTVAGNLSAEGTDKATLDTSSFSKPGDATQSALQVTVDTDTNNDGMINIAELAATDKKIKATITLAPDAAEGDTLTVQASGNNDRIITLKAADIAAGKVVINDLSATGDNTTFSVSASLKDQAGNSTPSTNATDSATIKTTASGKPEITFAEDKNNDGIINAKELSGDVDIVVTLPAAAVAGDKLTVTIDGKPQTITLSAQNILDQVVTVPATAPASGASMAVTATLTDIAGNTSPEGTGTVKFDTIAPGQPLITIAEATNGISAAEVSDGVQTEVKLPTGTVAGDKVTLTVTDPSGDVRTVDYTVTAADVTAGKAAVTVPKTAISEDGAYKVTAIVTDIAGNTSQASDVAPFTLDTTAPGKKEDGTDAAQAAPAVTIAEAANGVSAAEVSDGVQTEVKLPTGTVAGDKVTLTVTDPSGDVRTVDYTVTAADVTAGKAAVTVPKTSISEDGAYKVTATVTDVAGNTSQASDVAPFTLDTTAPGKKEDGTDAAQAAPALTIAEAANGVSAAEVSDGVQTEVKLPTGTVAGDKVTLTVTDPSGDVRTVDYTVTAADATAGKAAVTVPKTAISEDGAYKVSATVTDVAGNTSQASDVAPFTLDTTAPGKKEDGTDAAQAAPAVTIAEAANGVSAAEVSDGVQTEVKLPTGTVAGDKVTLTVTDPSGDVRTVDYTVTAADVTAGKAAVTVPKAALAEDGAYKVTAAVTDVAGNVSKTSDIAPFTLDTTAPGKKEDGTDAAQAAPAVTIAEAANGISAAEVSDGVQTEVKLPTGTVAGDKVTLTVTDPSGDVRTVDYTVTTADVTAGKAAVTVPKTAISEDGAYKVTAAVTDVAGNVSKTSDVAPFTLDTTAPGKKEDGTDAAQAAPAVTIAEAANGVSAAEVSDGVQTEVKLPTGTVAGDKITLTVTDPSGDVRTVDYTVTAADASAGKAAVTVPKTAVAEDGAYKVTATVTDVAGNVSKTSDVAPFTLDTTAPGKKEDGTDAAQAAPAVTIAEAANGISAAEVSDGVQTEVKLPSGTVAGDKVTLTVTDPSGDVRTVDYTVTAADVTAGKAAVTVPKTAISEDGAYKVSATVTDVAGNVSQASDITPFTLDTTAPGKKEDGTDAAQAKPEISIPEASNGINGEEVKDGVQTEVKLPTGTVAGDKITLTVTDPSGDVRTVDYTVTAADATAGKATVTVPKTAISEDGAYKLSAIVTDIAGNTSAPSADSAFNLDTVSSNGGKALGLTIDLDTSDDGLINKTEKGSATTTSLSATFDKTKVAIGDIVTFSDGTTTKTVTLNQTMIDAGKATSTDWTLPTEGNTLNITATLKNATGNATPEATDSAKIDTSAPNNNNPLGLKIDLDANDNGILNTTEKGSATATSLSATFDKTQVAVGDTITFSDGTTTKTVTLTQSMIDAGKATSTDWTLPTEGATLNVTANITDAAGNTTADATDSAKRDTSAPSVTVTMADKSLTINETSLVTFQFSENVTGFDKNDISIPNGSLSALTKISDNKWTATYTPNSGSASSNNTISVLANSYTDLADNSGTAGQDTYNVDTRLSSVVGGRGVGIDSSESLNGVKTAITFSVTFPVLPGAVISFQRDGAQQQSLTVTNSDNILYRITSGFDGDWSATISYQGQTVTLPMMQRVSNSGWNQSGFTSPLVLDLNGDGVQTLAMTDGIQFDLEATGHKINTGWVDRHDGLLAIDLNGNGHIDSGAELFGNHTQLSDGSKAANGWQALAQHDSNGDGQINAADTDFGQLRIWIDANSNGTTDEGELRTLAEQGIQSINLNADNNRTAQNGNYLQGFSSYTSTNGQTHQIVDAWFNAETGTTLDLSKITDAAKTSHINMAGNSTADTVKLTLQDVLGVPTTNGVHQLTLTGDTQDSATVQLQDWTDTGTTLQDNGHNYAIYNATNGAAAQLLIDQTLLTAGHIS